MSSIYRYYALPLIILSVLCLPAHAQQAKAKIITIEADNWCPINCDPKDDRLGAGIEVAKRIFEPMGYTVRYTIVPWTKALADVRAGNVDAVIGASRSDDPNLLFPENAITTITDDFYVLTGSAWRYQGPYTLKRKRIGIIAGYGYGEIVTVSSPSKAGRRAWCRWPRVSMPCRKISKASRPEKSMSSSKASR